MKNRIMNVSNILYKFINIIDEKFPTKKESLTILDFGCGSGKSVSELNKLGYDAYGCDVAFKSDDDVDTTGLFDKKLIRLIDLSSYYLPFEDDTFDFIISNQVFEHVQNYPETISEIQRVLKPGGSSIHIFPSRFSLIEPHVYVPLATVIRSYPWLLFWAYMGVRNKKQVGLSVKDVARNNFNYLNNNTNYLSKKSLNTYFYTYFNTVEYCESLFLKFSPRGRYIYNLSKLLPFIPLLYGTFRMRTLIATSPKK